MVYARPNRGCHRIGDAGTPWWNRSLWDSLRSVADQCGRFGVQVFEANVNRGGGAGGTAARKDGKCGFKCYICLCAQVRLSTPGRNESQTVASVKPTTAIVPPFRRFHSSNGSAGMALTSQWEMMCSRRRSLCKSTGMPNTLTRKWTWSAAGLEGMCVDPVQRSQCVRWSALRRRSLRMLLDHRSSTIQRPASPALNCILPTLHACRNS